MVIKAFLVTKVYEFIVVILVYLERKRGAGPLKGDSQRASPSRRLGAFRDTHLLGPLSCCT